MTDPYDPYGRIYTILSEESFEPVFNPRAFRHQLVLVLGWTAGRRDYVSIAMVRAPPPPHSKNVLTSKQIIPSIPGGANADHYVRIRSPRRRAVAGETTVTLRKNKRFAALVELSYVKLDWVWEVPFATLLVVPRKGMQLMLRAVSMEKIMLFYSRWGWDQTRGHYHQHQNGLQPFASIAQSSGSEFPQMTRQSCRSLNGLTSSGIMAQDGGAENEAVAGSDRPWDSADRPKGEVNKHSEEWPSPSARQEMVYAGDAHCAVLAVLIKEARHRFCGGDNLT